VRSSFKYLFLLLVLILISQTAFAQDTAEVQIVWNQDILVVINTSDENVNVSSLNLVSANGAIMAGDWVMDTYSDSNLSYSLAEFAPGSCLIAYPSGGGEQPELPETVECTQTVGMFTMTNYDDIVWDIAQGGFSAQVNGANTADCDINGTGCGVSVATTTSNSVDATDSEADDSQADILATWNKDIFVIINTSEVEVNISDLSFSSSQGGILPENWVMDTYSDNNLSYSLADVAPGSCLIAYLSADEQPDLPENVTCTQTEAVFTMLNINDMVWDVTHGGFSAETGGATLATCDINKTTCNLTVATTSADGDSASDSSADGMQAIVAIWNTEIMVVLNTSSEAVDLSVLNLSSSQGEILPENWVMNTYGGSNLSYLLADVAPGSCLIAYLNADEQPALPDNVTCTRTEGVAAMENISDIVWDVTHGGFSVAVGDATATCDISRTSCDIVLGG
jgi:hypothetical protein